MRHSRPLLTALVLVALTSGCGSQHTTAVTLTPRTSTTLGCRQDAPVPGPTQRGLLLTVHRVTWGSSTVGVTWQAYRGRTVAPLHGGRPVVYLVHNGRVASLPASGPDPVSGLSGTATISHLCEGMTWPTPGTESTDQVVVVIPPATGTSGDPWVANGDVTERALQGRAGVQK